jgi:uncharacterized protein (DUF1330 family)
MYYNVNDQILVDVLPKVLIKEDGSLFVDFHLANNETLADYGFYLVRNNNSQPPKENSIEIDNKRQIIIDYPYVDIIRQWTDLPTPAINTNPINQTE